jgi:hypothetical protein
MRVAGHNPRALGAYVNTQNQHDSFGPILRFS